MGSVDQCREGEHSIIVEAIIVVKLLSAAIDLIPLVHISPRRASLGVCVLGYIYR
jgi:hypothetical protein